jgi:hypothetical protein
VHLAAIELHRQTAADVDVALAAASPRRRTDRRYYGSWPVPLGDIALMGARAARAGITLRRVEALTDLLNLVAQAARQHAIDYGYLSELATFGADGTARRPVFPPGAHRNLIRLRHCPAACSPGRPWPSHPMRDRLTTTPLQ